jgi:hypothetical protein
MQHEQLISARAAEARQRETLERAREAPLGAPGGVAGDRRLLRAGLRGEAPVGGERLRAARGVVRGARAERASP